MSPQHQTMMIVPLTRTLSLILIAFLIFYEDRVSIPSCEEVPTTDECDEHPQSSEDLRVMIVADLLLSGSEAPYINLFFRDHYLSKFFRKSIENLKPDMLLVLGDVSARGSDLTKSEWSSVLQQFHGLLGPFFDLPFHVILGDRDLGECGALNAKSVNWIASSFPGLDSAGCGAFEISNISFVSLNAVALLCGNNKLRFSVEKAIERESIDMQMDRERKTELMNDSSKIRLASNDFGWRENAMSSGSGPVLLLHFPLHQMTSNNYWGSSLTDGTSHSRERSKTPERRLVGTGPYDLWHTLPPNATEYIFQALRPRIVFSAHTHEFRDRIHSDGTREVTVPAMTWDARDDPGFVVATFRKEGRGVTVSYCSLAKESRVLAAYFSIFVLLISTIVMANTSWSTNSKVDITRPQHHVNRV